MSDTQSLQTSVRGYLPIKHQRIYPWSRFQDCQVSELIRDGKDKGMCILKLKMPHNLIQVIQHVFIARTSLDILG